MITRGLRVVVGAMMGTAAGRHALKR